MRLDRNKIANALGIASMQASGTMQVVYGGGHLRGMYAGFSAQSAVVAALLAHKEVPGIDGVFEGKAGILNAFFEGQYDAEKILAGLGQDYLGATMLYKPWPVVGLAHTYIHATLRLMSRHSLEPASIEQIRVCVAERQLQMCEPLEKRRAPQTAVDAKFSLLYCVAMAAARGEVRVSDFTPTALSDQKVLAMAQRVVPLMDESASVTAKSPVGKVQVLTRDGRTFEELGDNIPGSLEAPMTWEDLARKFVDCTGAAALPVTAAKAQHVVALVERLEELEDATDVIRGLT
jgi:2-methylcitrate dehydratase PrpD